MINLSSLKEMPSRKRNFFLACILFLFTVFFGLMWKILSDSSALDGVSDGNTNFVRKQKTLTAAEQVRAAITDATSFSGIIEQVTTLKDSEVKFLRIRASVVDESQLSDKNFSAGSNDLPLREEVIDVAVTTDTVLSAGQTRDMLHSGQSVAVRTKEPSSKDGQLTATRIDILGLERSPSSPSPRAKQK